MHIISTQLLHRIYNTNFAAFFKANDTPVIPINDVPVRHNLCFKLQKVDKGDGTRHKAQKWIFSYFPNVKNIYGEFGEKRFFHYPRLFMLNL